MLRLEIADGAELRLLEPHHADEVFAVVDANRERLRRWLPWVDGAREAADTRAFIEDALGKFASGESIAVGIWSAGRVAGVIGADFDAPRATAAVGYWIAAEFEGRGLVMAATLALLAYLFDERNVHRVEIRCEPDNERSCAIPERLGFTYEGTARGSAKVNDRFVDYKVYSLLAPEYESSARFGKPER